MRASLAVAALSSLATLVFAEDHLVTVGADGLVFTPNQVTAAQGDTVTFEFHPKNHSVTQSTFANPCEIMSTPQAGVDSGFVPTDAAATSFAQWSITIDNASAPLWFFCAQTTGANHCQSGMVFAINPTADKSFDAYLANAKASTGGAASGSASAPAGTDTAAASGSAAATAGATAASGASGAVTAATGAATAAGSALPTSLGSVAATAVSNTAGGTVPTAAASGANTAASGTPTNGAIKIGSGHSVALLSLVAAAAVLL